MSGLPSQPAPGPPLRRGRLALAVSSLTVTLLVAAAAVGLLPTPQALDVAIADTTVTSGEKIVDIDVLQSAADGGVGSGALLGAMFQPAGATASVTEREASPATSTPPPGSGRGERVVFDEASQHVWLVRASGAVLRDYPVSGSRTDNLQPGSYQVYSRSRHATSFDLASTMEYMVRFTYGKSAAIGFHSIPVDAQGRRLQTLTELGTPQSHGCIRQRRLDARALWRFADVGTAVVVV